MTPERQAEIEALGNLNNPVMNEDAALLRFVCEAKRGIRELAVELREQRQRAEAAERERDNLREQLRATDARAEGWHAGRDNLRVACEKHRQRIAELEAEIERRNAAENRMFDGLEQLTNGDEPLYSSEVWYEW